MQWLTGILFTDIYDCHKFNRNEKKYAWFLFNSYLFEAICLRKIWFEPFNFQCFFVLLGFVLILRSLGWTLKFD